MDADQRVKGMRITRIYATHHRPTNSRDLYDAV
jgi:hypothetical protein